MDLTVLLKLMNLAKGYCKWFEERDTELGGYLRRFFILLAFSV